MTDLRRNIEMKFRCADLAAATRRALAAGAEDRGLLHQRDLFFPVIEPVRVRLKLRLADTAAAAPIPLVGELISYERPDAAAARVSAYRIAPVADAAALIAVLTQALGAPRELRKTRHLLIHGATRIHVDCVHTLNDATFVELETVVGTQSQAEATSEMERVVALLGLTDVVPTAYIDLITN
jgi:adenylate cyclase class IV